MEGRIAPILGFANFKLKLKPGLVSSSAVIIALYVSNSYDVSLKSLTLGLEDHPKIRVGSEVPAFG